MIDDEFKALKERAKQLSKDKKAKVTNNMKKVLIKKHPQIKLVTIQERITIATLLLIASSLILTSIVILNLEEKEQCKAVNGMRVFVGLPLLNCK